MCLQSTSSRRSLNPSPSRRGSFSFGGQPGSILGASANLRCDFGAGVSRSCAHQHSSNLSSQLRHHRKHSQFGRRRVPDRLGMTPDDSPPSSHFAPDAARQRGCHQRGRRVRGRSRLADDLPDPVIVAAADWDDSGHAQLWPRVLRGARGRGGVGRSCLWLQRCRSCDARLLECLRW